MADERAMPPSDERKMLSLEEGWEAELWRSAYGVTRFRLAQVAGMPVASTGEAQETRNDR